MQIEDDQICLQYLQRSKYNLREAIKRYRFDLIKKESFDRKNNNNNNNNNGLPSSFDQDYDHNDNDDDRFLFDDDVIDNTPIEYEI